MLRTNSESPQSSATLTVATAPASGAPDVTARLGPALAAAGLVATTDAGRLGRLTAGLGITVAGRVILGAGHPAGTYIAEVLAELRTGHDVLLVTGAGQAGTGDADRGLIAAAAAAGIRVTVLPGPSPVTAALAVAGFPAERFTVEGVPPRRADVRERRFAELCTEHRTLIFSESPRRVGRTLAELATAFGASRPAVVCRALAADQDVQRGTLGELASELNGGGGEGGDGRNGGGGGDEGGDGDEGGVTVVVLGAPAADAAPTAPAEPGVLADAVSRVAALVAGGTTTRDAVAAVAAQTGLRRRELYNAVGGSGAAAPAPADPGGPLG